MQLPKAVIFDWDNTLVDNWSSITASINLTRAAFGLDTWTELQVRERCNRALDQSFPEWFGDEWEQARDMYRGHFRGIHLQGLATMAGAGELLCALESRRIPLFVVSNKLGDLLRREAEYLGWTARFKAIIGSRDAARDKPERDPVDLALGKHGMISDASVWFVGDTHLDVECARNAGCTPILVHNMAEAERSDVSLAFSGCVELARVNFGE